MTKLIINNEVVNPDLKLIIFDKDGTLIDIHHYWYSMIELRAKKLAKNFQLSDCQKNELISAMGGIVKKRVLAPEGPVGIKSREFIVTVVNNCLKKYNVVSSDEEIEFLFRVVDTESSTNLLPFLKLLPGVRDFLQKTNNANIPMAIATTDLSCRAKLALNLLNIGHYFEWIVGGDNVIKKKPAPDCGLEILKKSNILPQNCVMIGDHEVDIKMAQACKMTSIGVASGLISLTQLKNYTQFAVNNFMEMDIKND